MNENPERFWEPGDANVAGDEKPDNPAQSNESSNEQSGEPSTQMESESDSSGIAAQGAPAEAKSEASNSGETGAKDEQQDSTTKMKEQLVDVSKKVGKTLSEWGTKVAQKSGELIEQGKLEFKISTIERKIAKANREVGEKLYNLWSQGRVEDRIVLDFLANDLEEIADSKSELSTLKELLENLKYEPSAKPAEKPPDNS